MHDSHCRSETRRVPRPRAPRRDSDISSAGARVLHAEGVRQVSPGQRPGSREVTILRSPEGRATMRLEVGLHVVTIALCRPYRAQNHDVVAVRTQGVALGYLVRRLRRQERDDYRNASRTREHAGRSLAVQHGHGERGHGTHCEASLGGASYKRAAGSAAISASNEISCWMRS